MKNIKGDIVFQNAIDVFVRDQCRNQGTISGGKHGGEPMDDTLVSAYAGDVNDRDGGASGFGCGGKGKGSPPLLSAQSDFGDPPPQIPPAPFVRYSNGFAPGTIRPTYRTTGLCGSIRFRREVQVQGQLSSALGTVLYNDVGFIGQKPATPTKTYFTSDPTDVTDNFGDK